MTIAEIERAIESKKRVKKIQDQEKASFDYILADMIGRSISRIYSSTAKMPELYEVYPRLFDSKNIKEQRQAQQDELYALRFKQFAQNHNNRHRGGVEK